MKIYKLIAALLLPGLAIFTAAFAQHILTVVWPGVLGIHFPAVTADGYFFVLCSVLFCFFAGVILQRRVGSRSGLVFAAIAPAAFLCLLLWALIGRPALEFGARIAWLRPITLFSIATAILPLLGLTLGWFYSGARRRRFIRASSRVSMP